MEQFMKINTAVNGFVWGPVMLVLLVGTGVYLSIAVGFIQFTKIGYWWKNTIGKIFKKGEAGDGEITPLQAVSTALASTVGTGNIAGVTGAINPETGMGATSSSGHYTSVSTANSSSDSRPNIFPPTSKFLFNLKVTF